MSLLATNEASQFYWTLRHYFGGFPMSSRMGLNTTKSDKIHIRHNRENDHHTRGSLQLH
jgi:hypothetical protein